MIKVNSDSQITINNINVQIIRKDIKNLNLRVTPPEGGVRVSVPRYMDDETVRHIVVKKLPWIRKQQIRIASQPGQSLPEMYTGESHYYFGKQYLLDVIERHGRHKVELNNNSRISLYVRPGTPAEKRGLVLTRWYRQQIKEAIPDLIQKWEPIIGVKVNEWRIKQMKTRWGSCNITASRIWLNLELVKRPVECLDYVVVHEMVHLLERCHNDDFRAYMDKFLPHWRLHRDALNVIAL
ncbi:MAG: SprT family zinc-dependent metalloprotease [Gammaproteobacteria bacterium]|nr:MAG: SprT family zinc-dependent metalloprotease [Gammaproteobacteria bacterium]